MKQVILFSSLLLLISCNNKPTIKILATSKDSCYNLKLGNNSTTFTTNFSLTIVENTCEDNSLIEGRKIPLGYTGEIISAQDYYEKEINICYKSLKNSKGKLILEYTF